ncbi:50S ribosomal protein L32 [Candidatus Gottesmanbacteria bacterium]|nr:50S ribosomal protein L32 [Candidatus Gottesmanbacteria bacterium]
MAPLPKRRHSTARSGKREKTRVLERVLLVKCPNCGQVKIPHAVCPGCGQYKVFELLKQTAPPKVIIDEAVELAKEFGGETSFSFVNGVLGTILKNL